MIKVVDANSLPLTGKFILFPLLGDKDCRRKLSPINRKIYPFSFWVIKIVDANSLPLAGKFILFPLWEPQPKSNPVGRFSNFPKNSPFFSERGRKNSNPLPNCPDLWEGISRPSIFLNLDRWGRRGDF
ncbi:MAG: hypothetical protein C6I01_01065 [Epsilonproteobacteria bacterium]|nr:hypothetical protein [Campylobacterota bacterium]